MADIKTTSALLYLDGISVSFDGFKALNELSFIIEPGEMRAIIGPNGAGKTTMMDVVTGKTRPDTGEVFFKQGTYDLSTLDETADRGTRHRAQIPEADRVRDAHGRRQPPIGAQERPPRALDAAVDQHAAAGRAHRRNPHHCPHDGTAPPRCRIAVARPEAVARDRHVAGAGAATARWSTSRWPA